MKEMMDNSINKYVWKKCNNIVRLLVNWLTLGPKSSDMINGYLIWPKISDTITKSALTHQILSSGNTLNHKISCSLLTDEVVMDWKKNLA